MVSLSLVNNGSGNGLLPDIWCQRTGSTYDQLMPCCLTAPSHYLNQCWLIISEVLWPSAKGFIIDMILKITHFRLQLHLPGTNELMLSTHCLTWRPCNLISDLNIFVSDSCHDFNKQVNAWLHIFLILWSNCVLLLRNTVKRLGLVVWSKADYDWITLESSPHAAGSQGLILYKDTILPV